MLNKKTTHLKKNKNHLLQNLILSSMVAIVVAGLMSGAYYIGRRSTHVTKDDYWKQVVAAASLGHGSLDGVFQGPNGLVGLVVESTTNHNKQVVWGVPGKTPFIMVGQLMNYAGKNVTDLAYQAEVGPMTKANADTNAKPQTAAGGTAPEQSALTPEQIWRGVSAAYSVNFGHPSPKASLYVFADANCPYCNDLYKRLVAMHGSMDSEHINVHWIPVAILSQTSSGRGAALLKGGRSALEANESEYNSANEQGGVQPIDDKELQRDVLANTALLLHDGQQTATPTLVWKDAQGVHISAGEPDQSTLDKIVKTVSSFDGG